MNEGTQDLFDLQRQIVDWDERGRIGLLLVHGAYTILIGAAMIADGPGSFASPSFVWLNWVPGGILTVAGIIIAGGACILAGLLVTRNRAIQTVGLVLIAMWDLAMAMGFFTARESWAGQGFRPTLYPVLVYMHLATIMAVHIVLITVWRRFSRRVAAALDASDA